MKTFLPVAALLAALLLPSCGEEAPTPQPTPPSTYKAEVTVTNVGTYSPDTFRPVIVQLRFAPLGNTPSATGTLDGQNQGATRGSVVNTFDELIPISIKPLYLTLFYADVARLAYVRPPAGEYVQAEIKINGVSKGTVRVDASTFNTPDNLRVEPNGTSNAVQELVIDNP